MIGAGEQRRPPRAAHHPFDVGAGEMAALRNRRHVLGRDPRSQLLREDHEHATDLFFVGRVEQRDMHLGASLPLEIDRKQIGTRGQQHPDDAAAILRVAHLRRDHREDAARRARVALGLPAAERRIRFVDDDDHGSHRAQHRQHALQVAFRLADVLGSEILEHDARHADLAAHTLCEERLAGSDGAAQQIPHREAVERAALEQRRVLAEPRLRGLVPHDGVERPFGFDELEEPAALALEQPLLQRAEDGGVEPLAAFAGRLDQDVEVGQGDACRQRRELRRVEVAEALDWRVADRGADERVALLLVRQRHFDRRDVRVAGQAIAHVRELLVDEHERHVQPLDVRAHRPVQHGHQIRRGLQAQASRLARRKDVRRLIHDHGDAQAIVFGGHDVVADEAIEDGEGRGRILGERAEVAHLVVREGHHVLEPLFVASGERAQPPAEVVVQHQRPAAEQLLGQKLCEHAVPHSGVARQAKEVVGVAVEDERGGRSRKVQVRELGRPGRKPLGQLLRGTTGLLIRRHAAAPGADRFRGWPAVLRAGRPAR